jgi:hypothetical protein
MHPPNPETAGGIAAAAAFAKALAAFQATSPTAASYALEDVLIAMAPARRLGFACSVQQFIESEPEVRLLHQAGWSINSSGGWGGPGLALANLLGIQLAPAGDAAQPPALKATAPEPPTPAPAAPATQEPDEFADADLMGEGVPETPVLPEDRAALSEADRETCLAMIRALTPEQRKSFTVVFRSHFNVDKSSRVIAPHIVQVQHQKFIQTYVDELELAGVAA